MPELLPWSDSPRPRNSAMEYYAAVDVSAVLAMNITRQERMEFQTLYWARDDKLR